MRDHHKHSATATFVSFRDSLPIWHALLVKCLTSFEQMI
jgi:hypothetical protein